MGRLTLLSRSAFFFLEIIIISLQPFCFLGSFMSDRRRNKLFLHATHCRTGNSWPRYMDPFFIITFTFRLNSWEILPRRSSGEQAVVTGAVPSPRYVPSFFVAYRVRHSHCSSIFIECGLLTLSRFPPINLYARKSP